MMAWLEGSFLMILFIWIHAWMVFVPLWLYNLTEYKTSVSCEKGVSAYKSYGSRSHPLSTRWRTSRSL